MNIAYFRKSTFSMDETIRRITQEAHRLGMSVSGTTPLPGQSGVVISVCNPAWIKDILDIDANLLGLIPCSVGVLRQGNDVTVGVGNPSILGDVTRYEEVSNLAAKADADLKTLVHLAAGVSPRKAKSLKLYSTTTCPYCKAEAAWLTERQTPFHEVHVDQDQKEAEEMVRKSGQMGVPVTAVTYDDGEEEFIVGFDRARLGEIVSSMNPKAS